VRRNPRFIPPYGKGSLYIRPVQHATEPQLGIRPCSQFWVLVFCSPVGSYFPESEGANRDAGLRLKVLRQGRVVPGGTGAAKAMGNYAGGIAIAHRWQREGFNDVLYLDARHLQNVTETSGSNVFVKLRGGTIVTPPLDDQILAGITRDSTIRVAREVLGVEVEERPLPIEEVLADGEEMFCTGTAWTVQGIREIALDDGEVHRFPSSELGSALRAEVAGIQNADKPDRFDWTNEVA
jgi:branched-chain amino acid aminotransferase